MRKSSSDNAGSAPPLAQVFNSWYWSYSLSPVAVTPCAFSVAFVSSRSTVCCCLRKTDDPSAVPIVMPAPPAAPYVAERSTAFGSMFAPSTVADSAVHRLPAVLIDVASENCPWLNSMAENWSLVRWLRGSVTA